MTTLRGFLFGFAAISLCLASVACGSRDEQQEESAVAGKLTGSGESCGGFVGMLCPEDETCVDVPDDFCDPATGGVDCLGTCQRTTPKACGGFVGTLCGENETCVDDTTDDCDPKNGGADCIGVCVSTKPACNEVPSCDEGHVQTRDFNDCFADGVSCYERSACDKTIICKTN